LTPHIFIVAQDGGRNRTDDVPVVADRVRAAGPLGGIYTALLASPVPRVAILACDMPFVTTEWLTWLVARDPLADVVVPEDARGLHPLCAVYQVRLADRLRHTIETGMFAVHDALAGTRIVTVRPEEWAPFDRHGRLLMNVNTPSDYAAAVAAAAGEGA
jgi:molybdopterin-guanine dinucleotide biosynthesis protein A